MTVRTIAILACLACVPAIDVSPAHAQKAGVSIVGGSNAQIQDHPYQVYVQVGGFFCGGSIRDETHVVTAAHCVIDEASGYPRIVPASAARVAFGLDDIAPLPPAQVRTVSSVAVDRRYLQRITGSEYDSAVLTVSPAIPTSATAQKIELADPVADAASLEAGRPATVTGFGVTGAGQPSETLQALNVPLISDPFCQNAYDQDFVAPAMLCAGGVRGEDACFGDSGGPLAVDSDPDPGVENRKLAGIVSFGSQNCGDPAFPGVYTEVAEAGTRTFITSAGPVAPPEVSAVDPIVSGPLQVGADVTCEAPAAPGQPTQFFFSAVNSAGTATGLPSANSALFRIPPAAVGQRLSCDVRYENDGGFGYATGIPTTAAVPLAASTTPALVFDRTRPRSRITRVRCSGRICITSLTASDAKPGAIRSLIVTLSYSRTKCRGRGARRTCRTDRIARRLRAGALGGGRYRVIAGRLTPGRYYRITVVATDTAGNRQAKAATRLFRVKRGR